MVAEPAMRDDVDRVAAAAGVAVVHVAQPAEPASLDRGHRPCCSTRPGPAAAARPSLPRRGHVIMVSRGEPQAADWQAAIAVGAQHVMTLPADEAELVAALSEAAESGGDGEAQGCRSSP